MAGEEVGLLSETSKDISVTGRSEAKPELPYTVAVSAATSGLEEDYHVESCGLLPVDAEIYGYGTGGMPDGQTGMESLPEMNSKLVEFPKVEKLDPQEPAMVEVNVKDEVLMPDGGGRSAITSMEVEEKIDVELSGKKKRRRRQKETVSLEVEEEDMGRRSKRPSRQHAKVTTYDEDALDAMMEEQIEGMSSRSRGGKRKPDTLAKDMTMEAMIAAALGFPRESLTEEEIAACVVSAVGGQEQENYIVVRNHILAKWRDDEKIWLERDTVMNTIRVNHSKLVDAAYKFLLSHGYINFGVAPSIKSRTPVEKEKPLVVIIGAGLAGLGAARHLMALGHKVIVLEGRQRPGGRVYTKKMEVENICAAADLGGSVVTGMHGNPLGVLARQLDWPLHKIRDKCPIYQPNGKPAVHHVDEKVEAEFNRLLDTCSKWREEHQIESAQVSLGRILEVLRQNSNVGAVPEERQLYDWHSANLEYANASLLTNLSLSHWDQDDPYEMGGDHCFLPGGNVRFVDALSENVPIAYGQTVLTITYGNEGVKVATADQIYEGDMALCTVPLGVLKRGIIKFEPPLPQYKLGAIQRLGFGLLNKVVMLFPEAFWGRDIDTFGHLEEDSKKRGEYFMFYSYAAVAGAPLLMALVAGEAAINFERTPPLEAVTRVMSILRGIFDPKGVKVPNPVQTVCTRWGSDSLCYGSYSNVAVGASGEDYDILAQPVGDRLFFAGEATNRKYPATMHGALLSGHREAANMARAALARLDTSKREMVFSKDMPSYSATLVELFKEPDLKFGRFAAIFMQQVEDPASLALLRLEFDLPAAKMTASVPTEKISGPPIANGKLFLYTTVNRQQVFDLSRLGGDDERCQHLCDKLGAKLVGRKSLGSAGDAIVAAIKRTRGMQKAGTPPVSSFAKAP